MKKFKSAALLFTALLALALTAETRVSAATQKANSGKTVSGAKLDRDGKQRVSKIAYGDGGKTREFKYDADSDAVQEVTIHDHKAGNVRTFRRSGNDTWQILDQNGTVLGQFQGQIRVAADGTYSYKTSIEKRWHCMELDGSEFQETLIDGVRAVYDTNGRLLKVSKSGGACLKLRYDKHDKLDQLARIEGSKHLTFNRKQDGTWLSDVATDKAAKHGLAACSDGSVCYLINEAGEWKVCRIDVNGKSITSKLDVTGPMSARSVKKARKHFINALVEHLDAKRLTRLLGNMKGFEQRMLDRAKAQVIAGVSQTDADDEVQSVVKGAYSHLAAMVEINESSPFFDKQTRVMLAETFVFHACDPSATDQGSNATCWISCGHIAGGMVGHANHLARLVKEVSVYGTYATVNGGEYGGSPFKKTFTKQLFDGMFTGPEAKWEMDDARTDGNVRSPLGLLLDQTLPVIGGRSENTSGWGQYWSTGGTRNIMYMVTGAVVYDENNLYNGSYRQTLLRNGAYITYLPGHYRSRHLCKDAKGWYVLQDDQMGDSRDAVIERIADLKQWLQQDSQPAGPMPVWSW